MNKYQRVIVIVAAANVALMLLFPPFLDNPLRRGVLPNFDGFYPLLTHFGHKRIHNPLLTMEIMFVVINALLAWLLLDRKPAQGKPSEIRYMRAIVLFLVANLVVLLCFPPFETYSSLLKNDAGGFDGFYFVAGDKRHRNFFVPLLYLEITLVVINALVVWLCFNAVRRGELLAKERIIELAHSLPPEELAEITKTLGYTPIPGAGPQHAAHLGAGPDRRKYQDPRYRGPERRKGGDRRLKTRAG
jgi:hypothetical protein